MRESIKPTSMPHNVRYCYPCPPLSPSRSHWEASASAFFFRFPVRRGFTPRIRRAQGPLASPRPRRPFIRSIPEPLPHEHDSRAREPLCCLAPASAPAQRLSSCALASRRRPLARSLAAPALSVPPARSQAQVSARRVANERGASPAAAARGPERRSRRRGARGVGHSGSSVPRLGRLAPRSRRIGPAAASRAPPVDRPAPSRAALQCRRPGCAIALQGAAAGGPRPSSSIQRRGRARRSAAAAPRAGRARARRRLGAAAQRSYAQPPDVLVRADDHARASGTGRAPASPPRPRRSQAAFERAVLPLVAARRRGESAVTGALRRSRNRPSRSETSPVRARRGRPAARRRRRRARARSRRCRLTASHSRPSRAERSRVRSP